MNHPAQASTTRKKEVSCPRLGSSGRPLEHRSLVDLRDAIARIEASPCLPAKASGGDASSVSRKVEERWTLGLDEVDRHLPKGGLDACGVHEIAAHAYGDVPAALGFTAALGLRRVARRPEDARRLLWCRQGRDVAEWGRLYGAGLESFGLPRERLLNVTLRTADAVLWTLEEALKSGALGLVMADGDGGRMDLTVMRRLMLAAAAGRTPGLIVFSSPVAGGTAARSRWRVRSRLSRGAPFDAEAPGLPAWQVTLERCRGGEPGRWLLEWDHAKSSFALASAPSDRTATSGERLPGGARPAARAGHAGRQGLVAFGLR